MSNLRFNRPLDASLLFNGKGPIAWASHVAFSGLMQDVDDLVNIVEQREKVGENDDIKLGIPSVPLIATLRAHPAARALLETVWSRCRGVAARSPEQLAASLLAIDGEAAQAHRELTALVRQHGVAPTVDKAIADAKETVALAPIHTRDALRHYAFSVVDRLHEVDPRAAYGRASRTVSGVSKSAAPPRRAAAAPSIRRDR